MNYKLLLQLEMEETKRLQEELALTKLKLEVAESRIKRTPSIPTNDVYNIIISNSSHFSIKD